jgi:hypothetical protein
MRWWVALLAIPVVGFQTPKETGGKMTSSELVERVKRKDWDLLMRQGLVGQGTGPLLLPLLNDPDPQVRDRRLRKDCSKRCTTRRIRFAHRPRDSCPRIIERRTSR